MANIAVDKIDENNVLRPMYLKEIKARDKMNHIKLNKNDKNIYGLFYDEHFLGSANFKFKRVRKKGIEKLRADILVANWSINDHDLILTEGVPQLYDIAREVCEKVADSENKDYEVVLKYKKVI